MADFKSEKAKHIQFSTNNKQIHVNTILFGQFQGLNFKIYAPILKLKEKLTIWGMVSKKGSPKANGAFFCYHDVSIIEYYKQKALGFLNYYKPANNFHAVKKLVDYHMRWSLLHTLAGKHNKKVYQIIKQYGKTPKITLKGKNGRNKLLAAFLTHDEVNLNLMSKSFYKAWDPIIFR